MATENEFTTRLIGFGLSEKEAQTYLYLLKYGPKTPSPLAKSLKTYREDIHRTLKSLVDKGMVRPSLSSPTVYAAVNLDSALEAALKKQESELREMEARKPELQELAKQHRFRAFDDVGTFKVLKNIREIVSTAIPIISSLEQEFLWIAPIEGLQLSCMFGINDLVGELSERGGKTRGITDITYSSIPFVQEVLDVGEDVRHFDGYRGVYYAVFDSKHCMSAINIDVKRVRLNEPAQMLYASDPVYSKYLASTFELLWKQSVPAEQRIQELLKQGPPQTDQQ
ncbi:MAG: TrmB family transcriptional regulator [Halobacteriota archaeon]